MRDESAAVGLMLACQDAWIRYFPALHRRAHWHIVNHLGTKARAGASIGELHGLVRAVFLLDDATVKERVGRLVADGLCTIDGPAAAMSARTIVVPTPLLLERFDDYFRCIGDLLFPGGLTDRPRIRAAFERMQETWSGVLDQILDRPTLSRARQQEAKRHLMSMPHVTILLVVLANALAPAPEQPVADVLADHIAARLLRLNGQNFHTTRDHIAYLIEIGVLRRGTGKSLRVGMEQALIGQFRSLLALMLADLRAAAGAWPAAYLVAVAPLGEQRHVAIGSAKLTIGRASSCDIVLDDSSVSRIHSSVALLDGVTVVTDLGSRNGTYVNAQRIDRPTGLSPGDRLTVGGFCFRFDRGGMPEGETTTDGRVTEQIRKIGE